MSKINDGGPAFPLEHDGMRGVSIVRVYDPGMTLRDWFAGQALQIAMQSFGPDAAAEEAYMYADAMIARRAELAAREVK